MAGRADLSSLKGIARASWTHDPRRMSSAAAARPSRRSFQLLPVSRSFAALEELTRRTKSADPAAPLPPPTTNAPPPQPFPLNPTFSPLPPLADSLKTKIYNTYQYNVVESPSAPDSLVVREVSRKYGVGMERVRAVIRLKELEKSWKEEVRWLVLVVARARS